jgi:hypothetical protein
MRSMKIAVLCLVALVMMSMGMAVSATAATPGWEICRKGASGTKYTAEGCTTASGSGEWAMVELKTTEKTANVGSIALKATEVPVVGTVEITCSVEGVGYIGPENHGGEESVTYNCKSEKGCEKFNEKTGVVPANLPWHEEALETEGLVVEAEKHGSTEKEGPGVNITCTILGVEESIECRAKGGIVQDEELLNVTSFPLTRLVLHEFLVERPSDRCFTRTGQPVIVSVPRGSTGGLPFNARDDGLGRRP